MSLVFLHPYLLLLLPLALAVRFLPRRVPWNRIMILRAVTLALLLLALAGPVLIHRTHVLHQVLLLDGNSAASPEAKAQLGALFNRWHESLKPAENASVVCLDLPVLPYPSRGHPFTTVHVSSTPEGDRGAGRRTLAEAFDAAVSEIPAGSGGLITLVGDGWHSSTDWGPRLQTLITRNIPVRVIELPRAEADPLMLDLCAETPLQIGYTSTLSLQVFGVGPGLYARITNARGEELTRSATLAEGDTGPIRIDLKPEAVGFLELRVELVDTRAGTPQVLGGSLRKTFAVQGPRRLLYLAKDTPGSIDALRKLLGPRFEVVDGSSITREGTLSLKEYAAVLLNDVPAATLPTGFQESLARAVKEEGLGLLYCGGREAYDPAAFAEGPLAPLLPVEPRHHTEKQDPTSALVLIIDTSGSMTGNRLELAKQIARLATQRLKAHDRVGIVEFYGNKHWALPLQSAANKLSIDRAIGRMQATGGTVLYPAIEEAYYGLKNISAKSKHIIIITDAGIEDANYEELARRIAREHMNLSTVLVGPQAQSKGLLDMANWGKGRFYAAADRYALPEILLKQTSNSELPSYKEGSFRLQSHGGTAWWGDLDTQKIPLLAGYEETLLRSEAESLLEIEGTGDPVLATWNCGAGRVTAFTSEPLGGGTHSWTGWKDYGRLLSGATTRTAGTGEPFEFKVLSRGRQYAIQARRLNADASLRPVLRIESDAPASSPRSFARIAPDLFELQVPMQDRPSLRARASAVDEAAKTVGREILLCSTDPDEASAIRLAKLDLRGLARLTSGAHVETSTRPATAHTELPFVEISAPASPKVLELGSLAALLALLLYLLEITWRRLAPPAPFPSSGK